MNTPADSDCAKLARACTAAARELAAARQLIEGYEGHIAASDARLEIARKEIELLKAASGLERERAAKLEQVIAAEREIKAKLTELKDAHAERVEKLEKKLSRSRKTLTVAVVATAVLVALIGIRK